MKPHRVLCQSWHPYFSTNCRSYTEFLAGVVSVLRDPSINKAKWKLIHFSSRSQEVINTVHNLLKLPSTYYSKLDNIIWILLLDYFSASSTANPIKSHWNRIFYKKKKEELPTGTCLILITPDSERTMYTFLGTAGKINQDDKWAVFFTIEMKHYKQKIFCMDMQKKVVHWLE